MQPFKCIFRENEEKAKRLHPLLQKNYQKKFFRDKKFCEARRKLDIRNGVNTVESQWVLLLASQNVFHLYTESKGLNGMCTVDTQKTKIHLKQKDNDLTDFLKLLLATCIIYLFVCLFGEVCAKSHTWRSEDKLGSLFSPSTM